MPNSKTTGPYLPIEAGVNMLLQRLGDDHPHYLDVLTIQYRLVESLAATRKFGNIEMRRAERATIVLQLNALALETLGTSVNTLYVSYDESGSTHARGFVISGTGTTAPR